MSAATWGVRPITADLYGGLITEFDGYGKLDIRKQQGTVPAIGILFAWMEKPPSQKLSTTGLHDKDPTAAQGTIEAYSGGSRHVS